MKMGTVHRKPNYNIAILSTAPKQNADGEMSYEPRNKRYKTIHEQVTVRLVQTLTLRVQLQEAKLPPSIQQLLRPGQ